jgi:quercetin dioxygenase-like cupin family protein
MVEGNMNSIRSRLGSVLIAAVLVTLPTQAPFAQQPPAATTVRTVLGVTSLLSAVDAPLFFKLSKVELAPGQTTKYFGPVGFLYLLSGSLAVQMDARQHSLQQDDALLVTAGKTHSLSGSGSEPALFLHFVLARSSELDQAAEQPPAVVTELYRTPRPIPDLKPGRYEFTLTRVSYPRMPPNVPHYRSGAALYYVRSGSGIFIANGKTETKEMGTSHFEPHGWVHQWANSGDAPLVLLQANISEEGVPAVIMTQPPPSGPGR